MHVVPPFVGVFTETIDCEFAMIEHRMYVHQKYVHLLVSQVYAQRKEHAIGGGILTIVYPKLVGRLVNFNKTKRYNYDWLVSATVARWRRRRLLRAPFARRRGV